VICYRHQLSLIVEKVLAQRVSDDLPEDTKRSVKGESIMTDRGKITNYIYFQFDPIGFSFQSRKFFDEVHFLSYCMNSGKSMLLTSQMPLFQDMLLLSVMNQ